MSVGLTLNGRPLRARRQSRGYPACAGHDGGVGSRGRSERNERTERHSPRDLLPQVTPLRVRVVDQPHLPGARPVLERLLAGDRGGDVVVDLEPDERLHAIALREPVRRAGPVLEHAADEVARDADIEHAVRPARHDVDEGAQHGAERAADEAVHASGPNALPRHARAAARVSTTS